MTRRKSTTRRKNTPKKSKKVLYAIPQKSRSFLPWPVIVLILLAVGVLLVGWTFQAGALSFNVTAKISAPLPTTPAIITNPTDGARFDEIPINVEGTCPLDSYVNIYTNSVYRGSVFCDSGGNFQIDVDLFPGANQLQVKVFNITDDEGPQSAPITVYYDVPVPPTLPPSPPPSSEGGGNSSGSSGSSDSGASQAHPLLIKTDFKYIGYTVGQIVNWKIAVTGGTPPYALNVDWGDGTTSLISRQKGGWFTISHQYKNQGDGANNTFKIKITASDTKDRKAHLQVFAVVNPSDLGNIVANTLPQKPKGNHWLLVAWPSYLIMLLLFISFWLGEKEELIILKRRGLLPRKS